MAVRSDILNAASFKVVFIALKCPTMYVGELYISWLRYLCRIRKEVDVL